MYYVYVLQSERDNRYYIGQTNNVDERLQRHNNGEVQSTRNRRPLVLIHKEKFETRRDAMKREKYLKSLKSGNEFRKIIHIGE
jgi:putative endonuclease